MLRLAVCGMPRLAVLVTALLNCSRFRETELTSSQLAFPNPHTLVSAARGQQCARAIKNRGLDFVLMAFQCACALKLWQEMTTQ